VPLALPPPPFDYLRSLACEQQLEDSFDKFVQVSCPPADFTGLLFVSRELQRTFQDLPTEWHECDPFQGWGKLFEIFNEKSYEIRRLLGRQVTIGVDPRSLTG